MLGQSRQADRIIDPGGNSDDVEIQDNWIGPVTQQGSAGLGLYLHWPFCAAKCPYCDFNSHVRHQGVDQARFVANFKREMDYYYQLAPGKPLSSIFFGGGTPSLMTGETVGAILDHAAKLWNFDSSIEITLEANPTSAEAGRFQDFRAAGVNRVSLGVQSFDDEALKFLGRMHSAQEAREAIALVQSIFERSSFDLIYALPGQSTKAWATMLEEACQNAQGHLSLYQLTIEFDTAFHALHQAGKFAMPDEDRARDLYDITQEITQRYNLPAYEVSNHAGAGEESQHNLIYWRYGEYLGIGPGAHGRVLMPSKKDTDSLARVATSAFKVPEIWQSRVETLGHGLEEQYELTLEEEGDEFLLMGLRLREGIDLNRFWTMMGRSINVNQICHLTALGFVELTPDNFLRVTPKGFPLLDAIVADLAL